MSSPPPPLVPPRPSRSTATSPPDSSAPAPPSIPPRPNRNRSKSPLPRSVSPGDTSAAPPVASSAAEIPLPAAPAVQFQASDTTSVDISTPEVTSKIADDLALHHPVPTMAAKITKERSKVSHTDAIPEIGQRVPMLPYAGDVQAPSPMLSESRSQSRAKRRSIPNITMIAAAGTSESPLVGDFGAYPSGNKVYKEGGTYSLSHDDLTKSVMQAVNGPGVATTPGLEGVPDEDVGYRATDEYTSRNTTPQATPGGLVSILKDKTAQLKSPLSNALGALESENDQSHQLPDLDDHGEVTSHGIYGRGGTANASTTSLTVPTSGTHTPWAEFQDEHHDGTPILASDEIGKSQVWNPPAVSPRLSAQEFRRPSSVASSGKRGAYLEPDDDISEPPSPTKVHEPLFPAGTLRPPSRPKLNDKQPSSQRFPSKDIWEDAPESVHETYEVENEETAVDPDYYDPIELKRTLSNTKEAAPKDEEPAPSEQKDAAVPPPPPARPVKRLNPITTDSTTDPSATSPEAKKPSSIPERPKPSIPPRPHKKHSDPTSITSSVTTESSSSSSASTEDAKSPPPIVKPKPFIAGKLGGIVSQRANFMNDLNSRLLKGPMAPKKEEPAAPADVDLSVPKEPLEDVRKSRARGPAKRKPTAAGAAGGDSTESKPSEGPKLSFSTIITVFSIGDEDDEGEVSFDTTKFGDEKPTEQAEAEEEAEPAVPAPHTAPAPAPIPEEETKAVEVEEQKSTIPAVLESVKDAAQKVVQSITSESSTEPTKEEEEGVKLESEDAAAAKEELTV